MRGIQGRLAGRTVPPQLVDTSSVRIASGQLSASYLEHIFLDSRADAVVFASGRFDRVPGFRDWIDDRFGPPVRRDGVAIYLLPSPALG